MYESGEKYAQVKHCLQTKTVQTSSVHRFWFERTTENGLFLLDDSDAAIKDFVGTIIAWGIIMVLQLLCIYLFPNITNVQKSHEYSLDIRGLFIAGFETEMTP